MMKGFSGLPMKFKSLFAARPAIYAGIILVAAYVAYGYQIRT